MSIVITIPEEKLESLIKRVMEKIRDEILREIFKDLADILKDILRTLRQLAEAQRRTEERLNQLVGEVAGLKGEVVEHRVISDLGRILDKYGFIVYSPPYDIREVDAVVEKDGFYALIQICRTCDLRDVRQVLEGARKFEEIEGTRPSVLAIFSYTGRIGDDVLEEAKKHNIIVEHSIRRLAQRLRELSGS